MASSAQQDKKSKKEAIPKKLFWRKVLQIDEHYTPGALSWLEKEHPKANKKLDRYHRKLDEVWGKYLAGKATLDDFNKTLQRWFKYLLRIIGACGKAKKRKGGEDNR